MICIECETKMRSVRENYRYAECGLDFVTLESIEVRMCPSCGARSVVIPQVEDLHRAIARSIALLSDRLTGPEVKYLRKFLGYSGADFAKVIGTTAETVSRWEHGKKPMGGANERLLRLMVFAHKPAQEYPLDRLAAIGRKATKRKGKTVRFADKAGIGWQQCAA